MRAKAPSRREEQALAASSPRRSSKKARKAGKVDSDRSIVTEDVPERAAEADQQESEMKPGLLFVLHNNLLDAQVSGVGVKPF